MNQPRTFGPYTLLRRLAVGGMAEIYVASTRGLGGFEKLAALKLVHPHLAADPQFVRMLVDEAKILVLLTHANIAQVFDLGCIDGTYYIAMEFVDGLDAHGLQTEAQRAGMPLPIAVCAYVVAEMLNGLDYAHRKRDASGKPLNIVHRDISPQNVVVSQAGEVKLVDFGIAKSNRQSEGTEAGVIKGKYFYMSPEQAWGDPTDRRSDVFSSGILLFEMLTGHMLYTAKSVPELLGKVRRAEVPHPSSLRGDIPDALSEIVLRALQREPSARYQSAIDMGEALRDFLYGAHPAYNAGKLAEFVTKMVEARSARELLGPGADDTRRLRALTREDFVTNKESVLFNVRDGGVLVTRQHAQGRPRRPVAPSVPKAPPVPRLPSPAPAPGTALAPSAASVQQPSVPPPERTSSVHPTDRPQTRISNWPLEEPPDAPTEVWSQPVLAPSRVSKAAEEMEPTKRYPAQSGPVAQLSRESDRPIPSVLPSLMPPAPRPNPFGEGPLTGTGKVALMPPRGVTQSLTPIPPSPPIPDFRAAPSRPWLPIFIGLLCAALGIVGYHLIPRPQPNVHLEIVSAPSGATVRVDGRVQSSKTPLRLSGLTRGRRYALSVELPGYQPWRSTHVAADTSVQQIAVLRPITRTLLVASTPEGADVFVGDTLLGRTPLSLPSMQVSKPLQLRLELSGHAPERREITLDMDDPEPRVHVVLKPR